MKTKKELDVIIPVFGAYDILQETLDAVKASDGFDRMNVIIYDATPEKDKKDIAFEWARVIHGVNYGFPKNCNTAARYGGAGRILFLNSDCVVEPTAIQNALEEFEDSQVGVVGARLVFADNLERIQHTGMAFNAKFQPIHLFLNWGKDNKRVLAVRHVRAVTGAFLMTTRSLFSKLKGFDEGFGLGTFEDVDYCLRVGLEKKAVIVGNDVWGKHYVGASARQAGGFKMNENFTYFRSKWRVPIWDDWHYY